MDVDQIEKMVGGKRVLDVVDCRNQQGIQMTLTRFVRYFKRRTKRKILNLLSLEFSDTQFAGKSIATFFIYAKISFFQHL